MKLVGDVALVTGASRGMGAVTAAVLSKYGAKVAVNYIKGEKENALKVADKIKKNNREAIIVRGDVGIESDVNNVFTTIEDKLGPVDILVNNAGIGGQSEIGEWPLELWQRILQVNLTGAMLCINRAIPSMKIRKQGRIISIASSCGVSGCTKSAAYSASKSGIHGLTRSVARDVAHLGITVNAIAPGPTATEMLMSLPKDQLRDMIKAIPMKRFARPEEISEVVAFLASEAASFITGQIIRVCGGKTI